MRKKKTTGLNCNLFELVKVAIIVNNDFDIPVNQFYGIICTYYMSCLVVPTCPHENVVDRDD